jgi:hypothetical protein
MMCGAICGGEASGRSGVPEKFCFVSSTNLNACATGRCIESPVRIAAGNAHETATSGIG